MDVNDGQKKKRLAIIGVSSLLLVAMVVAVTVGVGVNNDDGTDVKGGNKQRTQDVSASVKAIKTICQPTDYKKTCETNLRETAGNTTDTRELIKAAFKVAQNHINQAAKKSVTLQELENDPRTKNALQTCKELFNMSITELQNSFHKVGEFNVAEMDVMMADLKTWLSAAMTYQETCLDGFGNTTSDALNKLKASMKTAMELTANGLDIITALSSLMESFQNGEGFRRRLLQDPSFVISPNEQFPSWVDHRTRSLLAKPTSDVKPNLVVAKDGSGDYETITEALVHIPKKSNKTFVLYIKEGVYEEYININRSMTNLVVIGDGASKTRITGNKSFADGITTFHTSTVAVQGDNFVAKNIGFENTAGPEKHQAVALRVSADFAVLYNCTMDGYQDTLYAHAKRQFYRDCTITGTIDFVFGDAISLFQNCNFLIRKPLSNQQNIVTAQGRKQRRQPSAIIIMNSLVTAHPELYLERLSYNSYLGRPWKEFSRTIFMGSYIDDVIHPDGWLPWMGNFGLKTCWYAEFNNTGPGANVIARVTWNGIKKLTAQHAADFAPKRFFRGGDYWITATKIPYDPTL